MTDSVLRRHTERLATERRGLDALTPATDNIDGDEDAGAFGWFRGSKERAVMLQLRKKDGSIAAIAYSTIERMDFDASDGITLHVLDQNIRLRGRNLNAETASPVKLYDLLTRHRVTWIQEADQETRTKAAKEAVLVETIEW